MFRGRRQGRIRPVASRPSRCGILRAEVTAANREDGRWLPMIADRIARPYPADVRSANRYVTGCLFGEIVEEGCYMAEAFKTQGKPRVMYSNDGMGTIKVSISPAQGFAIKPDSETFIALIKLDHRTSNGTGGKPNDPTDCKLFKTTYQFTAADSGMGQVLVDAAINGTNVEFFIDDRDHITKIIVPAPSASKSL